MIAFGVDVEIGHQEVYDFVAKTNKRLESGSMVRSPFTGQLKLYEHGGLIAVSLKPLYPDVSGVGIFLAMVFFILGLSDWFYLLLLPFVIIALLNTQRFYYWVLKKGLRKEGYTGLIQPVTTKETLRRVMYVSE